jgi:hypothetical protein
MICAVGNYLKDSWWERVKKWARAHPGPAGWLAVCGVALVGGTFMTVTGLAPDEDYFTTDNQQMIEDCATYQDAADRYDLGQSSVSKATGPHSDDFGVYLVVLRADSRHVLATCAVEKTPEKFIVSPD